jgi:retinol dehydrogenase 14
MSTSTSGPGPMSGRTVLVTGATSGIGRATARGLARQGAQVALVGRDRSRTEAATDEIRAAGGRAVPFVADLSAQAEVRRLAREALDRLPRLDVLVNNVGGFWSTRRTTADGLEHTLAVNHLAPFLLTALLLERLLRSPSARIVNVASDAERLGRIDFDDLQGERSYDGSRAYNQSKLANVLFTYELARRLRGRRITANAVHPGLVSTSFGAEDPGTVQRVLVPFMRPFMGTPERGAEASIRVASSPELDGVTGQFMTRKGPRKSSPGSHDLATASRLWRVSADLVGLTPGQDGAPPHP